MPQSPNLEAFNSSGASRSISLNAPPVDRSGTTSSTPNTATDGIAANANRVSYELHNPDTNTASIDVNVFGEVGTSGTRTLRPGKSYRAPRGECPLGAVRVRSASASVPYIAFEGVPL